jgi:hypothetical protein
MNIEPSVRATRRWSSRPSASLPEPAPPGIPTSTASTSMSPRASPASAVEMAQSSRCTPARRSTPHPARNAGTLTAPGVYMEHIAMLQNGDNPATTTTWLEHITDDEYNGS